MKPDILYLKPFYEPTMAALEREFTVHKVWDIPNGITGIEQRCANVRAAISTTTTEVTRASSASFSATITGAPVSIACAMNCAPSTFSPFIATKIFPGPACRES